MRVWNKIFKRSISGNLAAEKNRIMDNPWSLDPVSIDQNTSLSLSAVWSCVTLLCDTISCLPIHLFKTDNDNREIIRNHFAMDVLRHPNSYLNGDDLIRHLMIGVTLWGNGYAEIIRDNNYIPYKLKLVNPYEVEPYIDTVTDELFYRMSDGRVLTPDNIIHLRGLVTTEFKGKSPIAVHRENIALCTEVQNYGLDFFTKGGNTESTLSTDANLTDTKFDILQKRIQKHIAGSRNSHKPLLLEGGMKYQRINIPLEDAQFLSTRKFQTTEIARIYHVPPHMIGDLTQSTNNNIEHQGMEFVQYTLLPYLVKIEKELKAKLLLEREQDTLSFKFNIEGLLRGDIASRTAAYKSLFYMGSISPNEIRQKENMNKIPDGDKFYMQQSMAPVNKINNPDE